MRMIKMKIYFGTLLLLIVWLSYYLMMHLSLSIELFFMISIHILLLITFLILCGLLYDKEYLKITGWLKILSVLGVGYFSVHLYFLHNDYYRTRRGSESTAQNCINEVGGAILSYVDRYGKYPHKENWYDVIVNDNESVKKYFYYLGGIEKKHPNIAFNENLSAHEINNINPQTIILIEANGPWNTTGDEELIKSERDRDKYYPNRDKFVYLYFADSTLAKYRVFDGSIALYVSDKKCFTGWLRESETKYLPLRWSETN